MLEVPRWNDSELSAALELASSMFRAQRMQEPLDDYLEAFDEYQVVVEDLLEATDDLLHLDDAAMDVLTDTKLLEAFRYLTGPPVSTDDLKTLTEAASMSPNRFRKDPDLARRIVEVVRAAFDRRRLAWLWEGRKPTETERIAAVVATTALMAASRLATKRRNEGKRLQEARVRDALANAGLTPVASRPIPTLAVAPAPGEFCGESLLGSRKADFVLTLWDRRVMPIECKVSNSATNSVKRLNNDAAAKAVAWLDDFGTRQVVPIAILSGVYKLHNLIEAQDRGLALFWSHNLDALVNWIDETGTR